MSEVKLDMYSGRRSPRSTLPAAVDPAIQRNCFGCRGFRATDKDHDCADIVILAETVEIRDHAGGVFRKTDPGRHLDRWLAEAVTGYLPSHELAVVNQDPKP